MDLLFTLMTKKIVTWNIKCRKFDVTESDKVDLKSATYGDDFFSNNVSSRTSKKS